MISKVHKKIPRSIPRPTIRPKTFSNFFFHSEYAGRKNNVSSKAQDVCRTIEKAPESYSNNSKLLDCEFFLIHIL